MIEGTTNVAPGTEVTLRVRSGDDTRPAFKNAETTTVAADGTFSAEFDFSEQNADDEYTVTLRNSLFAENPTVDGTVVETIVDGDDGSDDGDDGDDGNVTDGEDGDDGNVTDGEDGDDGNVTDGDDGTDDGSDGGPTTDPTAPTAVTTVATPKTARPASVRSSLSSPSSRLRSSLRGVTSNAPATHHTR